METFKGIGASEGIAIGAAVCINTRIGDIYQIPLPENEIEAELDRFREAVERTRLEIGRLRDRVGDELGDELAGIFDAQALVLSDTSFLEGVQEHIRREHVNAEWALQETVTEIQARFDAIDAPYLRERQEDLRHVCRYVVRSLRGIHLHHLSEVEGDVVIVADDLSPPDAVRLGRENVVGFVIEHGSPTSHTTIIARSLNLPAVLGVTGISRKLADQIDLSIIIDGSAGTVIIHPDEPTIESYRDRLEEREIEEQMLLESSELPPITLDGTRLQVMANIDLPEELDDVRRFGAAGIGLYRSEFLYIEKSPELPTEEEHLEIYRRMIETAAPDPAIIRTYDLGGRKIAREMMETQEANPVLGLRGIRLTLARPDIFKTQLRALMRATVFGNLWIMLPMVTIPEEVREFRQVAGQVMDELQAEGLTFRRDFKLGIMVEVPAAALITDILAKEVDFFSIGTNDLIQYALAVDRANEHVADLYRPLHPGMLRMLKLIVQNARAAGIEVGLCGEMAADERMTAILLGCGLRRLSVSPRRIPTIKRQVRELSLETLEETVSFCSNLATAAEVDDYLRARLGETEAAST
ncbi:MAG: phosphoenolpyruvate--protein phosphotransferase [bacterium]|nr:phosphoenolpyruvate--protein phosphotransferase [bacterium]